MRRYPMNPTHMDEPVLYDQVEPIYKSSVPGVMVIVLGNGHSDTSSNPGRDLLHFTLH